MIKLIQKLRTENEAINTVASLTLDMGITDTPSIQAVAKSVFTSTNDIAVYNLTLPTLTIKKLWTLKKTKYEAGPYKNKRIFASRDSSKHIVDVLKAKGYRIKFPNNLDFVHNLLREHKITKYSEFKQIIQERKSEYFCGYAQLQIDAMLEYGHLGE